MSYDREFQIRGMPYRRFVSDVVWSTVPVAVAGVALLELGVPGAYIAAACGAVTVAMGKMIHGRIVRERARLAPARRPRMARLMERYGVSPRRQSPARSMA